MKKTAFVLLSLLLCFTVAFGASAKQATITVDGVEVDQVDVNGNPVPDPGSQYLVPLRAVLNAMGLPVFYDEETGIVTGVRRTDPNIYIAPGDKRSVIIDGTTFVGAESLGEYTTGYWCNYDFYNNLIEYKNTRYEPEDGYYRILDQRSGEYLTADPLPDSDIVENMTNEDGSIEEVVKTPAQQIMASQVYLAEENDSDNQLWLIRKKAGKNYTIINKNTGLALDMNNWSVDNGGNLIQYTQAGGTNQQWNFFRGLAFLDCFTTERSSYFVVYNIRNVNSQLDLGTVADVRSLVDEYESDLDENAVIQYSPYYCRQFPHWGLELVEPYVNPVDLAIEIGAVDDFYLKERFKSYFSTDVYFSREAKAKAEDYLLQNDFSNADKETQKKLARDAMSLPFIELMNGAMSEKLTADYEIVGIEEKPDVRYNDDGEEEPIIYYVYTIAMECGPDDIHTFTVETVDSDDEEHVRRVCEAIACFEPPIRKALRHFYYTGENYGTWNAWDGEVWNNTGSKDSVDEMVNMFAHELGHVIDSYFTVGDDVWNRALNSDIVPVSGYGQNNRWEDFGEFSQLYLLSRGDDDIMAAIEKIYPARTRAYRAALYNLDNGYYADYKDEYDRATAPIGRDTDQFDESMYYRVTPVYIAEHPAAARVLTNNDGTVTFEDYNGSDGQLWQVFAVDDELVCLYSKADGTSLTIPAEFGSRAVSNDDMPTLLGAYRPDSYKLSDGSGVCLFTVSETGFVLRADRIFSNSSSLITAEAGSHFIFAPVEEISGIGDFTIRSGDKYLAPSSDEIGAPLVLSGSADMSLWHIYKLPSGVGYITNVKSGLAIDISGESMEEGAAALAYTLSRNPNQTWLVIENDNGTVSFMAMHSDLYLAADENGNIIQSSAAYEWILEAAE